MRRVLNIGSVNIDHVYRMPHFVRPGETTASNAYFRNSGGKGFNQSIALARAGARVTHAGAIGPDGDWLVQELHAEGVDVTHLLPVNEATGHAVIQLTPNGQNAILVHGGANRVVGKTQIERAVGDFCAGDHLLCQNETSGIAVALDIGRARGLEIWFNPAPMTPDVEALLDVVDWLVVNETEGQMLSGKREPDAVVETLRSRWPRARLVLTLGEAGVIYADERRSLTVKAPKVAAVDTTAAGDTFIGYLIAGVVADAPIAGALQRACRAAALSVTRAGAAGSIPFGHEV